ncbi:MAG: halocyanin domain protein [Halonotius sp. J07HN6]|jgi:halocyanin domain|nr:MAG: halocyanin domain protein [Halonotius sp. J07HN6]ERH05312.1 MAG: halocyanin domain protein [Halonotius sp. J07HN4]
MDEFPRRRLLSAAGGASVAALAGCLGGGDTDGPTPYDGYLRGANNFEAVADRTDASTVTVAVGANSGLSFAPAAVKISPETTVVWEWTGRGGQHNIVAGDGSFESEYYLKEGSSFSHTFESPGVYKYHCTPHQTQGMLGVIEVVEP